MSQLFIGLISGTSLDSLDAALTRIDGERLSIVATHAHAIPDTLRDQLLQLCAPGANEIDRLGDAELAFARLCSDAVAQLLQGNRLTAADIVAIGSHGQTVRHRPPTRAGRHGFTLQLGDPNTLAALTGIDVIADFRRMDMALGGQGAPLASGFHRFAFAATDENRAIINIGGMSNITRIDTDGAVSGCDTGPGNVLMDSWIQQQRGEDCDVDGAWAGSGRVDDTLLKILLADEYLSTTGPKSTGRETYNLDYLQQRLNQCGSIDDADVQRTLLEFTARTIVSGIDANTDRVYICGGGAHNKALMARLQALCDSVPVSSTNELGISPDWVEAAAFAWLAWCRLNGVAGNVPAVTGAQRPAILGGIYSAALPASDSE